MTSKTINEWQKAIQKRIATNVLLDYLVQEIGCEDQMHGKDAWKIFIEGYVKIQEDGIDAANKFDTWSQSNKLMNTNPDANIEELRKIAKQEAETVLNGEDN